MKPPSRQRSQPNRYLNKKPELKRQQTKNKLVCKGWNQTEQRTLIQGLKKQSKTDAGCNGEIHLAELKEKLPKRSIREIETLLAALKNLVIRGVAQQVMRQRREQKKAKVPIELWAEMAADMAGILEEPITTAFSQMLVISSTEPCSLRNSDPPCVDNSEMHISANSRTIPLRPMPVPMAHPLFKPTQIIIAKPPYISPGQATLSPVPTGTCNSPIVVYTTTPQPSPLTPGPTGAAQPASTESGLTSRGGTVASLPATDAQSGYSVSHNPSQPAAGASTMAFVTAPSLLPPSAILTSSQSPSATVTSSQPPSATVTSSQLPSAFPSGTASISIVTGSSMAIVKSLQPLSPIVKSLQPPSAIVTSLQLPSPFVTSSQPSSASSSGTSAPQPQLNPQANVFTSSVPTQLCFPAVFQPTVTTTQAISSVSSQQPSSHPPSASTTTPHTKFGRPSKFAQEDQPRANLGLRCIVDFEKIYRYLSTVHKPNQEYTLTPMESAVVLDLLMSLPEELPLLDCAQLQQHMIQVHAQLSSPVVGAKRTEHQSHEEGGQDGGGAVGEAAPAVAQDPPSQNGDMGALLQTQQSSVIGRDPDGREGYRVDSTNQDQAASATEAHGKLVAGGASHSVAMDSIGSQRRAGQQAITNAATPTQAGRHGLSQSAATNKTSSQSENTGKVKPDWEKAGVCPLNPFMVPLKLLARR